MERRRSRYRYEVAWVGAASLAALSACGPEIGGMELDTEEPLARAEQRVIPGAAVTQIVHTFFLPAGGTATDVAAKCPSGSKLVGGGHFVGTGDVRVHASYGFKTDWRISVINLSNTAGTGIDVYAQCLSGTNATSSPEWLPAVTVGPGVHATSKLACRGGNILTGGGYSGSVAIHPFANNPEQTDQGVAWAFGGKNMNNFGSSTFAVQAWCVAGVSGGTTVRTTSNLLDPGIQFKITSDPCPSQTLLTSGGFIFAGSGALETVAKGNLRNVQNPSLWNTVIKTGSSPVLAFQRTACVELWAL